MRIDEKLEDFREELIYGPGGRRGAERRAEIAHERELSAIRMNSRALIWAGPVDELTRAITRWYESGWIVAESLQEALQKASSHFVGPNGMPIIAPAQGKPELRENAVFPSKWSLPKYRSVIKSAILSYLVQNPDATAAAVCHGLDEDGGVELPKSWKVKPDDRSYFSSYSHPSRRGRIEKTISGIRRDMRKAGLLPQERCLLALTAYHLLTTQEQLAQLPPRQ